MTVEAQVTPASHALSARLPLATRFALRELRGGFRGFYVFLACIFLGTATIAAVNSLAAGLTSSIDREGQSLVGGDLAFSLIHRPASQAELDYLEGIGRTSVSASLRSIVRTDGGKQALVELKAVDDAYPLYGTLELRSGRTLGEAFACPDCGTGADGRVAPAVVDASLLATARLDVGDVVSIGRLSARIVDVIEREPDKLSGGIAFGPRVLLPLGALPASGLVNEGSLVRWHYRVAGRDRPFGDAEVESAVNAAQKAFPAAGWRVERRSEAAPNLRDSIGRFAQFLTLVGLTSLAVGGVGVGNAVRAFLLRKRQSLAIMRSLGASPAFVVRVYGQQIMILALIGVVAGLCLGAVAPPVAGALLDGILPVSDLFRVFPGALGLAAVYGMMTAVAFAAWPLSRAFGIRPIALFRDDMAERVGDRPRAVLIAAAAAGALLLALVIAGAYDRTLAAIYVAGVAVVFVVLFGLASAIMWAARRAPRAGSVIVRMAIANIHRRGALTPTVTLSLGLSLTLLATLSLVDGNLRYALTSQLPKEAPSFFFVDIQSSERDAFLAELNRVAPEGEVDTRPMLRGRIVSINGVLAQDWPETEASWVLRGDRGITYAAALPEGSHVVAGAWWTPDTAQNEVSFAADLAAELGVKVGDTVKVNVLGREVEAKISNLRTVEWESLSINFVMVFSPSVFAGAPHAHLATLTFAGGAGSDRELVVLKDISEAFPTVTSVRVKDALDAVNGIVADLILAVRAAASVTLVASMLVLAGTLAASHRSRIYDAVILKVLGARRRTIVLVYSLEYALLGLACAIFATGVGTIAGWYIVTDLMELDFTFLPMTAAGTVAGAVAVTVGFGLVGTWRALGEKPARVLRNL